MLNYIPVSLPSKINAINAFSYQTIFFGQQVSRSLCKICAAGAMHASCLLFTSYFFSQFVLPVLLSAAPAYNKHSPLITVTTCSLLWVLLGLISRCIYKTLFVWVRCEVLLCFPVFLWTYFSWFLFFYR